MSLWSLLSSPVWGLGFVLLILVPLLRLGVQIWYKIHLWDLQGCSTDLTGKTAVVTGANSGECSSNPDTSLRTLASNSLNREGRRRTSTHYQKLCPPPTPLAPLSSGDSPD